MSFFISMIICEMILCSCVAALPKRSHGLGSWFQRTTTDHPLTTPDARYAALREMVASKTDQKHRKSPNTHPATPTIAEEDEPFWYGLDDMPVESVFANMNLSPSPENSKLRTFDKFVEKNVGNFGEENPMYNPAFPSFRPQRSHFGSDERSSFGSAHWLADRKRAKLSKKQSRRRDDIAKMAPLFATMSTVRPAAHPDYYAILDRPNERLSNTQILTKYGNPRWLKNMLPQTENFSDDEEVPSLTSDKEDDQTITNYDELQGFDDEFDDDRADSDWNEDSSDVTLKFSWSTDSDTDDELLKSVGWTK